MITTPLGPVEVHVQGTGIPVLIVHGSPGGVDAARMMGRFLPADDFTTIALSRPGYLHTPLHDTDTSIDHEADLLAAVLDTLGVDRAAVFAWSGGGPSAYRLAVRHPHRVSSLIQVAAVSSRWIAPKYPASDAFLFGTALGNWIVRLLARIAPGQLVSGALAGEGSLRGKDLETLTAGVMADPAQRDAVLDVAKTMSWNGARRTGWDNDDANYGAIDTLELDRIQAPVLLIHGSADTDALPEHSHNAHEALPHSTLVMMDNGTHLAFYAHPDAPVVQRRARTWIVDHA
ncbi:alpha/beta hydrolase [Curtobacterium sp. MCPF17_002]|uniref:alpha/beta fold hydrolase n=1 Tax=Curtobacterium sp. MCPF17_002 TaxID=2175645 RepID=UPI001C650E6F|nr:alpha/beta hydrolase [Curtobacterium sp. MCPF17_002]WIB76698.1 alpha/beta hydrolase [Curtobacterium sp. MCPF17_002]